MFFRLYRPEHQYRILRKLLYDTHKIEVRGGLHCSPIAYQTLGEYPHGAVRVSLSNYHTDGELNHLYNCITDIIDSTSNG